MKYQSFCSSNSSSGFITFFPKILEEKSNRVYYIKGGPGCGKSTLLQKAAKKYENAEMILCSGDPNSLDGLILPEKRTVLIDATAPHCFDPRYPGVAGNIVDLGKAFLPDQLNREKIIELNDRKAKVYRSAYRILNTAGNIYKHFNKTCLRNVSEKEISDFNDRWMKKNSLWEKQNKGCTVTPRYFSAITPEGTITLNESIKRLADHGLIIQDRRMIGNALLWDLETKLTRNGVDHINGYHPLFGENALCQIIIPQCKTAVVLQDQMFSFDIPKENGYQVLSMNRFLLPDTRKETNKTLFIKKLFRQFLDDAVVKLSEAKEIHLKIEAEYAKGIDFTAVEKIQNNLLEILP